MDNKGNLFKIVYWGTIVSYLSIWVLVKWVTRSEEYSNSIAIISEFILIVLSAFITGVPRSKRLNIDTPKQWLESMMKGFFLGVLLYFSAIKQYAFITIFINSENNSEEIIPFISTIVSALLILLVEVMISRVFDKTSAGSILINLLIALGVAVVLFIKDEYQKNYQNVWIFCGMVVILLIVLVCGGTIAILKYFELNQKNRMLTMQYEKLEAENKILCSDLLRKDREIDALKRKWENGRKKNRITEHRRIRSIHHTGS